MRILTFSDIHYKDEYKQNEYVGDYLNSFKQKIQEIHKRNPIDAVFISGDIAFSGEGVQYKSFAKVIRDAIPKQLPIFCTVGNHDVNWTYLKEAIGDKKSLENLFSVSEEFIVTDLASASSKFKNVFKEFHVNFNEDINEGINHNYEYKFCDKNYSGYVWIPAKKMLFILLNSSWYSFGPGVIKHYYNDFVHDLDIEHLREHLFKYIGDSLSQIGKQSYFFSSFPYFKRIDEIMTEESDVRVITLAHHPPTWLKWDEQFLSQENRRNLNELLKVTDLLITGHLHNPILPPAILQDKCFHMSNGAFLDYHFVDNLNGVSVDPYKFFPENWFNIIDIGRKSFTYESYKFKTKMKEGKSISYNYYWEQMPSSSSSNYIFNRTWSPTKNIEIKSESIEGTVSFFQPNDLNHVIELLKEKRGNLFSLVKDDPSITDQEEIVTLKSENGQDYLIVINNLEMIYGILDASLEYSDLTKDLTFSKLIESLFSYAPDNLPVLAFYDFLVSVDETVIFEKFQNERFILFQSFKHKFFSKFKELFKFTELSIIHDTIME